VVAVAVRRQETAETVVPVVVRSTPVPVAQQPLTKVSLAQMAAALRTLVVVVVEQHKPEQLLRVPWVVKAATAFRRQLLAQPQPVVVVVVEQVQP
jgi:hypothetical protein